jgi:hypothetical protein
MSKSGMEAVLVGTGNESSLYIRKAGGVWFEILD